MKAATASVTYCRMRDASFEGRPAVLNSSQCLKCQDSDIFGIKQGGTLRISHSQLGLCAREREGEREGESARLSACV